MKRIARSAKPGTALRPLVCAAVLALISPGLWADASLELQYPFDRFEAFPELAGATVNAVVEGEHGGVWVGSQDGLFHFDGVQVRVYRAGSRDTDLLDSHVLSLLLDQQERLWIGTMQGIDRFDPDTGRFSARRARQSRDWLTGVAVLSLHQSDGGDIWAGTADEGLHRLSAEGQRLSHFDGLERGGVLSTPDVWDIQPDHDERYLWLATEGGLNRLDTERSQVDRRLVPPGSEETRRQRRTITSLAVDGDESLWVTTLAGAWRYDRQGERFDSLANWSEALAGSQMHVVRDRQGGLWFASLESGLVHCTRSGTDCRSLTHDPANPSSLPTSAVRRVVTDRAGRLWLATNDGLARLDPARLQWGHYRFAGLDGEHPEVWALARWQDELYLGTFGQGLWRADWRALKSHAAAVALERIELGHDTPWSLMVDSDDRLWVSTFGGGLFRLDAQDQAPARFTHDPDDPDSISFDHVWHVTEDRAGLWVGTYGGGLDRLDPDSGRRLDNWFPDSDRPISSRRVPLVLRDGLDRLWAATYGGGLNRWRPDSRDFEAWRHDPADPQSLPHDFIADMAEGPDGRLWLATEGGGLARLEDPETGRFETFGESEGLLSAKLAGLRFTPGGALWVSHGQGLQRFESGRWQSIRPAQGLQDGGLSSRSHAAPEPGWLVFGGAGGINVFDADSMTFPEGPAAPRIQEVVLHRGQQREDRRHSEDGSWRFPADVDAIGLRFSSYYMDSTLAPRFRYRLDGGTWVEQTDPSLALIGLAPDRYRLELQAALDKGPWSPSTYWSFRVLPPWWAGPVAWAVYALALLLLVALGVRYRMRRVAAHNRYLKSLLQARGREHRLRVRAMEAGHRQAVSEELLAQKRRLFASLAHELRTPLTALALTVDAGLREQGGSDQKDATLEAIRSNVRRLTRVSQQILSLSDIVADEHLPAETVELQSEVRSVAGALRALLAERNIELGINIPEAIHLSLKPGSLELILFNLIDNAWKYAGERARIEVRAERDGHTCMLEVADNGPGMSPDFAGRAFEHHAREPGRDDVDGRGLGLPAVRAMVQANGGRIELDTAPGRGCRYRIRLPLDPQALVEPPPEAAVPGQPDRSEGEALGTLLLVEDDHELRELISRLLVADWKVIATDDGRDALERAEENLPDVIVADVDLPGMRGDELCRRIKADPVQAHTPVLLVTALDSAEHQAAGFAALADDYITKPFDAGALRSRLQNLWRTLERNREFARRDLLEAPAGEDEASAFVDNLRRQAEALLDESRLSVDHLAAALHVSPRHLARLFARRFGDLTPRQYIDQLQARRAGERIAAGTTLEQVAEELGYSSSSYLSRKFKQWYGVSVREFRHRNDRAGASCPKSDRTGPASD